MADSPNRQVLSLALPIVATNILSRGPAIVDTAFIGHIGADQLAAVGLAQLFIFSMQAFTHATAIAGTVMVAHRTGENRLELRQSETSGNFTMALIIGLSISAIAYNLSAWAGTMMGTSGAVHGHLVDYLSIYWWFFTFKLLSFFLASIFQGSGDSRTPLKVIGTINILNVALDYGLIFGKFGLPEMGVRGAALATGISETLGASALIVMAVRQGLVKFGLRLPTKEAAIKFAKLAIPVLGERLLNITTMLVFARMVISFSVTAYAAHMMGVNIEMVSLLSGFAFMQATTALVGQNLGAKKPEKAKLMAKRASFISFGIMTSLAALLLVHPEFWVRIFTDDKEVIFYGIKFLSYAVWCLPIMAIALTYAGGLRGAGEVKYVMYITTGSGWLVRLLMAYIFGFILGYGVDGLWVMMPVDWIVRAIALYLYFHRRDWGKEVI